LNETFPFRGLIFTWLIDYKLLPFIDRVVTTQPSSKSVQPRVRTSAQGFTPSRRPEPRTSSSSSARSSGSAAASAPSVASVRNPATRRSMFRKRFLLQSGTTFPTLPSPKFRKNGSSRVRPTCSSTRESNKAKPRSNCRDVIPHSSESFRNCSTVNPVSSIIWLCHYHLLNFVAYLDLLRDFSQVNLGSRDTLQMNLGN